MFFFFFYCLYFIFFFFFFFSSRRRHTRSKRDWSSDVCSSDLADSKALCSPSHRPCWTSMMRSAVFMAGVQIGRRVGPRQNGFVRVGGGLPPRYRGLRC